MTKLVFASANEHKLQEIRSIMPANIELVGLANVGIHEEIPETSGTLKGNAFQKANYVFEKTALPCFSDDTGLEIDALNGRPGVNSAIYAGEPRSAERNIQQVLVEMKSENRRSARFKTVICFCSPQGSFYFEGTCEGTIGRELRGEKGFGYDSIFYPQGNSRTFAEMSLSDKKLLSHRSKAFEKFLLQFPLFIAPH
ncbi:MAG: RdgB/HAM1 family non-canonical purine NTP pyrophosphatase, partial [Bacteroidota bacterium]